MTEFKYYEVDARGHMTMQKLNLHQFLDMCNGEIISYGIDKKPSAKNVMDALEKAIEIKSDCPYRRTFHSNQGWAYQMKAYAHRLKTERIFQSMSRSGNCLDNSVVENFFGLLKQDIYYVVNIRRASYNVSKQETKAPQVVLEWTADPNVGKLVMTKKSNNVLEANAGQLTYIEKDKTLLFTGPLGNLTYKPENKALIDSVKQNAQAFWKDRLENKLFMVDFGYPRFVVKDIKFVDKQAK